MSRKHRIVHLISLVAIVVSLLSPILSLPVTADEPPPAPDVTLTTGEDGTPTTQDPLPAPVETEEPVIDEPVVDEPIVDEPIVDEPVVDEPVVDEPVVDEPVVEEPVVDEPVVDEPISVVPVDPILTAECGDASIVTNASGPTGVVYTVVDNDDGTYMVEARLESADYQWGEVHELWTLTDGTARYPLEIPACEQTTLTSSSAGVMNDGEVPPPALRIITVAMDEDFKSMEGLGEREFAYHVGVWNDNATEAVGFHFEVALPPGLIGLEWGSVFPNFSCVANESGSVIICTAIAGLSSGGFTNLLWFDGDVCGAQEINVSLYLQDGEVPIATNTASWTHRECPPPPALRIITVAMDEDFKSMEGLGEREFAYHVGVWNDNATEAVGFRFEVALPPGLIGLEWGSVFPNFSCVANESGSVIICTAIDGLSSGGFTNLLWFDGDVCGAQEINVSLYLQDGEVPIATNNASWTHRECPELAIELLGPASVDLGAPSVYIVRVNNTGSQDSANYAFDLELPPGTVVNGSLDPACSQDSVSGIITCGDNSVPAGFLDTYLIYAVADAGAEGCTTAPATATGTTGVWNENQRVASLNITINGPDCAPMLTLDIAASKQVASPGETIEITYQVTSSTGQYPSFAFTGHFDLDAMIYSGSTPQNRLHCSFGDPSGDLICVNSGGGNPDNLPGGGWRFTVPAVPSAATCQNGITSTLTLGSGPWSTDSAAHTLSAHFDVDCQDLTISKDVSSATVAEGSEFTYTVKVLNSGRNAHGAYAFTDTMPAGVELVGADAITAPDGSICTPVRAGGITTINCEGADVPMNSVGGDGTHTYTFTVRASYELDNAICGTSVINTVIGTTGPWGEQNTAQATTSITCPALLTLTKSADKSEVVPGDIITYTVEVKNSGTGTEAQYLFFDDLPEGTTLVFDPAPVWPAGASCIPSEALAIDSTTFDCLMNNLPAGQTHTYKYSVQVTAEPEPEICGDLVNIAWGSSVGSWDVASKAGVNSTVSTNLGCAPDLSLEIAANKTVVEPGDEIEYTVTVTNNGPGVEDRYLFRVALPADTRLVASPVTNPAGIYCQGTTTGDFNVDCQANDLLPGQSHVITYTARVSTSASSTMCQGLNTWLRGTDWGAWDATLAGPNGYTHSIELLCPALSIAKTDNVAESVGLNEPFTYTITVTNSGESAVGDFTIIDYLPAGIVLSGELDDRCETGSYGTQTTVTCADTGVPMGAGGVTFDITVMAVETDGLEACAGVENKVSGDRGIWVPGQQTAFASTVIDCITALDFSVEPLKSPVVPGEKVGFVVTIHNAGNTRIVDFDASTILLPELPDDSDWTVTVTHNGNPADLSDGPPILAPGDTYIVAYESIAIPEDITVPENEWCALWSAEFSVWVESSNDVRVEDSDAATVLVNCTDLVIDQQVSAPLIEPGGEVTYTITVTNHGNTTVSPMQVHFDASVAGTVFSNWSVTSPNAVECWVQTDGNPTCWYLTLAPHESAVLTITAEAPALPTWEQCAPINSEAYFYYGEVLTPLRLIAAITPPYTPIYSNTVTTQLDCQPGISIDKIGGIDTGADGRVDAGDVITYSFEATNSGNVTLYDIAVTDDMVGLTWSGDSTIAELLPGTSQTLTATYVVTQADIDAGMVTNTASVSGSTMPESVVGEEGPTGPLGPTGLEINAFEVAADEGIPAVTVSGTVTEETVLKQEPGILLVKSSVASTGDDDVLNLGEIITYTFTVTNTGNVSLTAIEVADDMDGVAFTDGSTIASLAPGAEGSLTATYIVTQADVDLGIIVNCADVSASDPNEAMVSDLDKCATDLIDQNPSLLIVQTCPGPGESFLPNVGDNVTYEITISNDGGQTVHDVVVSLSRDGELGSAFPSTLAPGQSETRTWTTVVTQADYDAREMTVDVTATGETDAGASAKLASMAQIDAGTSVTNSISLTCPMGALPVTPEPATPEPVTPTPATPDPATPDPATLEPTKQVISKLPETGAGGVISMVPVVWATMLGALALGAGAAGVRKKQPR